MKDIFIVIQSIVRLIINIFSVILRILKWIMNSSIKIKTLLIVTTLIFIIALQLTNQPNLNNNDKQNLIMIDQDGITTSKINSIDEKSIIEPGKISSTDMSIFEDKDLVLSVDNFSEILSLIVSPGTLISPTSIREFNVWNDGLGYKTYNSNSYGLEIYVSIPKPDKSYVKDISYKVYKLLHFKKKDFVIAQVFLLFEADPFNTVQVTLGNNVIQDYFKQGEGNPNDFHSWVETNKVENPENVVYAEDQIWINYLGLDWQD